MKRTIYSLMVLSLVCQQLFAQETGNGGFSLQQCVLMAVEKNINVRTARIDKEKSGYKINETRAALLPKVNLAGSLQDNLSLPTTLIPGSFLGKPGTDYAMKMGSQYSSSASVSVSQVLFNRTAVLAVEIARKSEDISQLSLEKAGEEIVAQVARLYFLAQTTAEQQKLIEGNIARAEKMRDITKLTVENGLGKQVDLDRVNVNLGNYYTQLSNTKATLEQQLNLMKYLLDLPQEQPIFLTEKADRILLQDASFLISDFSDQVDIKLLESQQEMNLLNQKSIRSGYLPTLSLSGSLGYQGLQSEFKDYFKSGSDWYPSSYINLNLSVPLFDGNEKRSKSHQARLEYQKTREKLESTRESFGMDYKNAMNAYQNNKTNVTRQQENLRLAEKVYEESSLKYRQGMSTMSNLLQDETSLSNAQAAYLTALYNCKDAEVEILSLNGEIKILFQK